MNIAKNMEAIFLAAIAFVSVTGLATASGSADVVSRAPLSAVAPDAAPMQVVTVSAKRLTAAEKALTAQ